MKYISIILLALVMHLPVHAHVADQSYIFLSIDKYSISGKVEITVKDLNRVLDLGLNEESPATMQEILSHAELINAYVLEHIDIGGSGNTGELEIVDHGFLNTSFAQFVQIHFQIPPGLESIEFLEVENTLVFDTDNKHRSLLVVENDWETGVLDNEMLIALTFSPENTTQRLDLSEGSLFSGLWAMIKMGVHHIWIGVDHILFLIALLLPSVMLYSGGRWAGVESFKIAFIHIIKIVTVFTIAHSITLSLAVLNVVMLPSRLVESIIALSIGIAAVHIVFPRVRFNTYALILAFGLFHGFGFANVLGEIQIPDRYMLWSLLGFNLGVELGQLAIVAFVVPVLFVMRNWSLYARVVMPCAAVGLIAISVYWLIERAFDVDFQAGLALRSLIGI